VFDGIGKAVGHGGLYKCSNCGYQGGAIIEVSEVALKELKQAERRRIKFREGQQRKRRPSRY